MIRCPDPNTLRPSPTLILDRRDYTHCGGRVEDGRGSLGHSATLRFPSPLIEPDVPISGIRLSDWLHLEAHGEQTNRTRLRYGE